MNFENFGVRKYFSHPECTPMAARILLLGAKNEARDQTKVRG